MRKGELLQSMQRAKDTLPSKQIWDGCIAGLGENSRNEWVVRILHAGMIGSISPEDVGDCFTQAFTIFIGRDYASIMYDYKSWDYTHEQMIGILDTAIRLAKLQVMA